VQYLLFVIQSLEPDTFWESFSNLAKYNILTPKLSKMKKLLPLFLVFLFATLASAQVSVPPSIQELSIVNVPSSAVNVCKSAPVWSPSTIAAEKHVTINNPIAGSLANALITGGYGPLSSITHLTVTGNLNSVDISQMNTNMTALTFVDISGVTVAANALPANAFQNKTTLTSVILPSTLVSIGDNAFSSCTSLSGVIPIPASVTSIGNSAFQNCTALTGILTFPLGLTTISNYAFAGCTGLTGNLTIPGSVTSIGSYAFQSCSGFTGPLSIPNSVISIASYAFQNCTGFTGALTLPNAITIISPYTFSGCSGLSGVLTIPLSVNRIYDYAFYGCAAFAQLIINKNVNSIGDCVFYNCSGLQKISVAQSVPPTIYANTFTGVNRETTTLEIPVWSSLAYETADYWSLFIILSEAIVADTYGITIQIGTGGDVKESNVNLGNGSVLIASSGAAKTFTFAPNPGYAIATVSYAGVDVKSQIINNQYTTPAVNANTTLNVTFQKIQYKVSIQTGGFGVMNLYYDYGATPSFDFTPSIGSKIQTVFYNGVDVTASLVGSVFNVPAITANSTLVVNFVSLPTGLGAGLEKQVRVYSLHSEIIVEGIPEGKEVTLYSVTGVPLQTVKSHGEQIILQAKSNAVYLLRTASRTYKVIL